MRGVILTWCALSILAMLAGCSPAAKLAAQAVSGGAPDVAANVVVGKEASQTLGQTINRRPQARDIAAQTVRQSADQNRVAADRVENVVVNEGPSLWMMILVALLVPSPVQWAQGFAVRLWKRLGFI